MLRRWITTGVTYKMLSENSMKSLDYIKNYWQLFAFGVFLLGFITFSFYMQINGFSFVLPDLKFLIAFGLIVFILVTPTIYLAKYLATREQVMWIIPLIPVAFMPILFLENISMSLVILFAAVSQVELMDNYVTSAKNIEETKNKEKQIDIFFYIMAILLTIFIDYFYILLALTNIFFFYSIKKMYKAQKIINPTHIAVYVLIATYVVASLSNNYGLAIADMRKTNIEFISDKNQTISGALIFQDSNTLYFTNNSKRFSIDKSHISSPIQYKEYKYEHNNSIFEQAKPFLIKLKN